MTARESHPARDAARDAGAAPSGRAAHPTFRELARAECDALLRRRTVARIAYAFRDRVSIADRLPSAMKMNGVLLAQYPRGEVGAAAEPRDAVVPFPFLEVSEICMDRRNPR